MQKYIVNCEVTLIYDTDEKGNMLLKPVLMKEEYAKVFDTREEVYHFLNGDRYPEHQYAEHTRVR